MFALLTCLVIYAQVNVRPELASLFESHSEQVRVGRHEALLRYRLLIPRSSDSGTSAKPLIVWFHGRGEGGIDNVNQLKWMDQTLLADASHRNAFFVLAIQCPDAMSSWGHRDNDGPDMIDYARALIDMLLARYPIDVDRIYLIGISNGGTACWTFLSRYPSLCAAACPMGSNGLPASAPELQDGAPLWAFHSRDDVITSVASVRRSVERLRRGRRNAWLTEITSSNHDCWTPAFRDHKALEWLLRQRRGERPRALSLAGDGVRHHIDRLLDGWKWWEALLQLALLAAIAWSSLHLRNLILRRLHTRRRTRGGQQ